MGLVLKPREGGGAEERREPGIDLDIKRISLAVNNSRGWPPYSSYRGEMVPDSKRLDDLINNGYY